MCVFFFGGSFFEKKVADIWKFQWIKYYCFDESNTVFWRLILKKMSAKNFNVFGPPTTKRRLCKIFTKLTRNHLLMDNIFKLREYQTFGLMKMDTMCKIWFANNIFSLLRWNRKHFHDFSRAFKCQKLSRTSDCAFNYIG